MITRNTKNKGTNRQHDKAAAMLQEGAKYPKFRFFIEWLQFIDTLPKVDGDGLLLQIAAYGIHETEPKELTPEAQEFFNREIRPELDRQHKRLNEGKRI